MQTKYFYILLFALLAQHLSAQKGVGINTESPTKMLDVNGDARIRELPVKDVAQTLSADEDGVVGIIYAKELSDMGTVNATEPVDVSITSTSYYDPTIIDGINLGLELGTVIPAGKTATVVITYSVPVGRLNATEGYPLSYYGIQFLRKENNGNFVEADAGSRKYSVTQMDNPNANMANVSNVYIENIDNTNSSTPLNLTYKAAGYVEQSVENVTRNFRFNMWSNSGNNKNWGVGTISKTVYIE